MATKKTKVNIAEETAQPKRMKDTEFVETGNIGLDLALTNGLGIPMGSNIMFFGRPGHGKTTLIGDMIRRLMERHKAAGIPFRIHYIDSENSRELLSQLGVMDYVYDSEEYVPQQVIYHPNVNTFAYLENVYTRITNHDKKHADDVWGKDVKIIIVDSITNLIADSQLEADVNKADYGDNAKARKKLYLKWLAPLREYGLTNIWTSQVAVKQGATAYEDPNKPAITNHDEHNMEIIVKMVKITDSKRTELKKVTRKTIDGDQDVQLRYITKLYPGQVPFAKNRFGQNIGVELLVKPGYSVLNAYIVRNLLEVHKFIKKPNALSYSMSEELADYLGPEAPHMKDLEISKFDKRTMNLICKDNLNTIVQFLKEREKYSVLVNKDEEGIDDGLE